MSSNSPVKETTVISPNGRELSRLLTAAVINQDFQTLLLTDPRTALTDGYHGEVFHLKAEEEKLIYSIQASSLSDFAMQLVNHKNGNNRYKGN
jgi:hypothetical protein